MMTKSTSKIPIAVLGMACRLPGADDLEAFWQLVRQGRQALGPVPEERFNRALYHDPQRGKLGKSYTDLGGLVSYRPVDRSLCPISDEAIEAHDIAHVTLCEIAAAACHHAGMDPAALPYPNTGVYVGHARASGLAGEMVHAAHLAQAADYLREVDDFDRLGPALRDKIIHELVEGVHRESPYPNPNGGPFLAAHNAAGLISRTFHLNGPYMAFNAACASSVKALIQAVRALQLGHIDMALVGGASYFHSDTLVLFSAAQSVSPNGSHPFTADADGMIVAEGYVTVVLKRLDRALADKDPILAVLPRVAISSDGRGKSLWAPRKEGQIEAIRRAYDQQVSIDRLQYLEAHATSTDLGDATELRALGEVLTGPFSSERKLPIGSVKANIGHTLEAAGLASLAKTVLSLQNKVIPPATDGRPLSRQVDWDRLPVFPPAAEMAWPEPRDGQPRRAGMNAFGIGGLNVHVVVDEFSRQASRATGKGFHQEPASAPARIVPASSSQGSQDAVAIVGMGAVWPGARTLDAYWDLLVSGRDPKIEVPAERWNAALYHRPDGNGRWTTTSTLGGFITGFEYDWRKHKIPPKQIAQASPLQFMILDAVDQAFHQAGYEVGSFDRARTGVVVGTVFGGDFSGQLAVGLHLPELRRKLVEILRRHLVPEELAQQLAEAHAQKILKHMPALLDETGSFTASALASRITKSFDLMGGAVAVDAGTASSMAALQCCVDLLRGGDCNMMVCVGGQQSLSPLDFAVWSMGGRLSQGRPSSPWDARADGGVPGEGCGAILLKRLEDARRDGDTVHGILRGIGGAYLQGTEDTFALAAARARKGSGTCDSDVVFLETAATGKAELDAREIDGIRRAYRSPAHGGALLLGSVAGQIGLAGGASGMASLLKAVLALDRGEIPAEAGYDHPAPFVNSTSLCMKVPERSEPLIPADPTHGPIAGVYSGGPFELAYHILIERGSKMHSLPSQQDDPSTRILQYDATWRRREAMREKAATGETPPPAASSSNEGNGKPVLHQVSEPTPTPTPIPEPPVTPEPSITSPSADRTDGPKIDAGELEPFLINFVVEQTGYPPEIVELDADLEADLGIDSIKKAQLFGELGEYFDVQPSEDLTLDDFPTLRHVMNYLLQEAGPHEETSSFTEPEPQAPVVCSPEPPTEPPREELPPAATPKREPTTAAAPSPPASLAPAGRNGQDLEAFLINFVVEQTGYPPDIVDLDADLEADLGIDSIKKAQLFGELGEYFDVQPSEDLTLDDFPTLRHVRDYLVENLAQV